MKTINTITYGTIPIAKNTSYLTTDFNGEIISDCDGIDYEIRTTLNGQVVALQLT